MKNQQTGWRRVLFGTRTRILGWCILLIAVSDIISILAIRQTLFARLERRIHKSLIQEVEEFRQLVREGKNPKTGKPFGNDVNELFKLFMSRNIPDDDEFLLAILDGKLDRASPRAVPAPLMGNSYLIEQWWQLKQPSAGEVLTNEGTILYKAEPLIVQGEVRGVFVVVHWLSGEREEVDEAVFVVIQVGILVLAVASTLAWITAGRVLKPLRELTETARDLSESDLTRRIPVHGTDEIAELSDTFNEMLERLETAFASQRNFIDDVGHELRTPITIIRGYLELLGHEIPQQRETIELVTDELGRMNRFVDDLLLLAKAEQPDFLNLELVDIGVLTEELYAKAKALGDRKWLLEGKGKGRIVADRQRVTQAIVNLAQNATQHTKKGDEIALGSAIIQGKVHLWVRDTGAGISLADQKRIFERFARGSASRSRREGMGLGLAIVRAIAEAHGGSIELVSQPGAGSTFTLILPPEPPQEVLLNEQNSHC
ncbi:MAG TPA: two-component sensor histidine kinase [Cyanobacteria bacterium UBA11372]|nr:two-component sensor histidine kinase [Cyanobacteria bacterium UBA11372]